MRTRRPTTGTHAGTRLDAGQYLALWRRLDLGEHPLLLSVLDHGRTYAERDALDAAAWTRLSAQGLLGATGAPAAFLADMLAVLAAPACEVDVRVAAQGAPPLDMVAATRGVLGVVAWLGADHGLHFEPVDPADPAGALLDRLPDRPAAPGVPISLPAEAVLGDGVTLDERASRLRRAGVPARAVVRLRAMWSVPPERVATFGVAVRDVGGVRRRGPRVISMIDTASGRVAVDLEGSRLVVRPTDRGRLGVALAALLETHRREVS